MTAKKKPANGLSKEIKKIIREYISFLEKHGYKITLAKNDYKTCSMQLSKKCIRDHENCGGRLQTNYYMNINNKLLKAKKSHICKDCIKEYVYKEDKTVDLIRFKKILQMLDMPFLNLEYVKAVESPNDTFGTYYKNVAFNHLGEGWEDGEIDELANAVQESIKTHGEVVGFWGEGFSDEDYVFLEEEYNKWLATYDCGNDKGKKLLFQEITHSQLDIRKTRAKGDSVDKKVEYLQKLMASNKIKPSDKVDDNKDVVAGVWIEDIEKYRPADYFNNKKLFQDFDGLKEYIDRFMLRPLKNLLTGTRDFDDEFSIEDDKE